MKPRNLSAISAVAISAALALRPAPAHAQMAVFDSASYGQLVQTVANDEQQLTTLQSQLSTQLSMIRSLPDDAMTGGGVTQLAQATQGLMQQISLIQSDGTNLTSSINGLYPTDYTSDSSIPEIIGQLASMQATTRSAYQNSMALQNQVAANQPQISAAVAAADEESMNASGPTGAVQASNQILGTMSQQLGDQQALMAAAYRAQEQQQLNNQSAEVAAQQAAAEANTPYKNTGPTIDNPFSDVGN